MVQRIQNLGPKRHVINMKKDFQGSKIDTKKLQEQKSIGVSKLIKAGRTDIIGPEPVESNSIFFLQTMESAANHLR